MSEFSTAWSRTWMKASWPWGVLALLALVWPSRLVSSLDGAPLDSWPEVVLVGLVFPLAWMLRPRVFQSPTVRVCVALLAVWKLATWALLTQQGLCATFALDTGTPGHHVLRRSWDFRAAEGELWPRCSAVLTRSIASREAFPAWFLNLNLGVDRNFDTGIVMPREPRLPAAVQMHVLGYLASPADTPIVDQTVDLGRESWRFDWPVQSSWWGGGMPSIDPPTTVDALVQPLWILSPVLSVALVGHAAWRAVRRLRLSARALATVGGLVIFGLIAGIVGDPVTRAFGVLAAVGLLVPSPWRLRNGRAVIVFIGVPLMAMFAAMGADRVGRFTLYSAGDDWQTYQRFASRIVFDSYWLEGGEATFWQQPLYRWVVGGLHVAFGDSSIGELYLDGFALVAMSALAYALVRTAASHRWGLAAAVLTVATVLLGPTWHLLGRGLAEFTGVLFLSTAALAMLRVAPRETWTVLAIGAAAVLAVYTRLNYLLVAAVLPVLSLRGVSAASWPRALFTLSYRLTLLFWAVLGVGLTLFALRTWYYTGQFSILYGTTRHFNSTGLGVDTLTDSTVWRQVLESVLMVVTVADPPRFDPRSLLVVTGVASAVFALAGIPGFKRLPAGLALVCVTAISSAFVARGLAYPGRFSLHLIPFAVALSVLILALLYGERTRPRGGVIA